MMFWIPFRKSEDLEVTGSCPPSGNYQLRGSVITPVLFRCLLPTSPLQTSLHLGPYQIFSQQCGRLRRPPPHRQGCSTNQGTDSAPLLLPFSEAEICPLCM